MLQPFDPTSAGITSTDLLRVSRRQKWTILGTVALFLVAGVVAISIIPPVYRARAQLLVQAGMPSSGTLDLENPLVGLLTMTQPPSVGTQVRILQSRDFVEDVLSRCGLPRTVEPRRDPRVRVAEVRDTSVIEVTVESRDPQLAARVANTMLDEYQRQNREYNLEEVLRARQFVEKEVEAARRELEQAEQALIQFRRDHQIGGLSAEQESRTRQLVELESRLTETAAEIAQTEAQITTVKAALDTEPVEKPVPSESLNPRIDVIQSRLVELQMQRAALAEEYQESSPRIAILDAQIARLREELQREPRERRLTLHVLNPAREEMIANLKRLQTEREGLRATRARLLRELNARRYRVSRLGPWEVQLTRLSRSREAAEKRYLALQEKLHVLQLRENARGSSARPIEHAVTPTSPIRPRKGLTLALSLLLGLLAGLCLALLRDRLDDRIATPDEADRMLGLPVLATIPTIPSDSRRLMTALPPASALAESYRFLRTNVNLATLDEPARTMIVTSAHAGEGKSTTAINLAIAMAMEGRRVVLVDADLRNPGIHRILDLPAAPGLTEVLQGAQPLESALRSVQAEGLLVLTSGSLPPNPAELLNSPSMKRLIEQLSSLAEVTLFDTPPCLSVTDAQVLAAKVDAVLLVAGSAEARTCEVRRAKEMFDRARTRTLGLVLSKASGRPGGSDYRREAGGPEEAPGPHPIIEALTPVRADSGLPPRNGETQ